VLGYQMVVTLVAALLAGSVQGVHAATSALLGGSISVISGYAYAWRALRTSDGTPRRAFRAQVAGEGYKFALTLLLFAAVFKNYAQVEALPLFLAYASTIVVYWLALLKQR
jgi:ATP synthase protein I